MVFGTSSNHSQDETQPPENFVDIDPTPETETEAGKKAGRPLLEEVRIIGAGTSKNAGGTKVWVCNHCNKQFVSSYTRMHVHFFGAQAGKKAEIQRCSGMIKDREKLQRLLSKVKEAESGGVSRSLKNAVLSKNPTSKKRIEEAFGVLERNVVDLKIVKGMSTNGIPFNVLRNPQFIEMLNCMKKAPDGYKPPSSEKARTVLLDECVRDVDKDLIPVKDTWYTQGVSIVSDGWSNVKHKPLRNVLAVNARGAVFLYAQDYSGVEKTGVEISKFLIVLNVWKNF